MPNRKKLSRRQRPVKRLLDDVLSPKKSPQSKSTSSESVNEEDTQCASSCEVASCSSSRLKRYELEVNKSNQGKLSPSPDLTLTTSQQSSSRGLQPTAEEEEVR
jgi:hypothetical protein